MSQSYDTFQYAKMMRSNETSLWGKACWRERGGCRWKLLLLRLPLHRVGALHEPRMNDHVEFEGLHETYVLIRGGIWTNGQAISEIGINRGAGRAALSVALADAARGDIAAIRLRQLMANVGGGPSLDPMGNTAQLVRFMLEAIDRRSILVFRRPKCANRSDQRSILGEQLLAAVSHRSGPPEPKSIPTVAPAPSLPRRLVATLGREERFEAMLFRVPAYLPTSMRAEFEVLLQPKALAATTAIFSLLAVSQLTPVGWIADLLVGVVTLGLAKYQAASLLLQAIRLTIDAKTEHDLDFAARSMTNVVAVIGVTALVGLLVKVAGRLRAREGGASSGAAAPESPPTPRSVAARPAPAAARAEAAPADTTMSANLDAAAMAQALREAARDGVPFCEECERARRAMEAA